MLCAQAPHLADSSYVSFPLAHSSRSSGPALNACCCLPGLEQQPGGVVLDLYCGTGTIGLSMAKHARWVLAHALATSKLLASPHTYTVQEVSSLMPCCVATTHTTCKLVE